MNRRLTRLTVALGGALLLATMPVSLPTGLPLPDEAGQPETARWAWAPTARADEDELDVSIDEIGKVKRGKKNVLVRADVGESGLICKLKVKYADGNADTPDDDVESDRRGICEIRFDVPNRRSVVGDAIAKLKVETKGGKDRGKASRGFVVRDRRG